MKSVEEWMGDFKRLGAEAEQKADAEGMADLTTLIATIQADALEERQLRYECAALQGLLANSGHGTLSDPEMDRLMDRARAVARAMHARGLLIGSGSIRANPAVFPGLERAG